MEYRQTDGKTRRVHKQYVDVVARILAGGQVVPVTVCWVDGRCFTIDEIISTTGFGLMVHGIRTATYKVGTRPSCIWRTRRASGQTARRHT